MGNFYTPDAPLRIKMFHFVKQIIIIRIFWCIVVCRFFWTGCVYGCRNDAERFGFFCHAALEFLHQGGFHPVSL